MVLLLLAVVLRVLLIQKGGQFFTPDESRYAESRIAAGLILKGKIREGLALPFATGEHPGFKLIGILPALVEARWGDSNRIPAAFFGGFSMVSLGLIWLCARRLGLSATGQFWSVLFSVSSLAMFFYSRHVYPYDAALCLGLGAFYVGLKRDGGWGSSLAVGALAAGAFLVYLAYWFLAGAVLALHLLRQRGSRRKIAGQWIAAAVGFVAVIGGAALLARLGSIDAIGLAHRFAGLIYDPKFGSGWVLPWAYLFHAEHLLLFVFIGAAIFAVCVVLTEASARTWDSPAFTNLMAVGLLYLGIGGGSDVLHRTVATGRVDRVLVPFLCLLGGWALGRVSDAGRMPRWAGIALIASLAVSSGLQVRFLLRQEFPRDFRQRAVELMQHLPPPPAGSYYRLVNVDHYNYEGEVLPAEPAEVLLAADHPYQFVPYLYEAFSTGERTWRRSIDQRMRLVRMVVPANEKIQGEPFGRVTLEVKFPAHRSGFIEPLLSLGHPGAGNVFFVSYLTDTQVKFCMESVGYGVFSSERMEITPGRTTRIECFCGSLLPPPGDPRVEKIVAQEDQFYRNLASIWVDGKNVLQKFTGSYVVRPEEVYAGVNLVDAGTTGSQFGGSIVKATRGGLPALTNGYSMNGLGAVRVLFQGPLSTTGRVEPLAVWGETGRAVFGFIVPLPDGRVAFGIEVWGVGAWRSEPLALDLRESNEVIYSFGALYPPLGNPAWGDVGPEAQANLKGTVKVIVNGRAVLSRPLTMREMAGPLAIGKNAAGGSVVDSAFSGKIVLWSRVPLTEKLPDKAP